MRGDGVNGKRREREEQIWTGNLRMLHREDDNEEEDGEVEYDNEENYDDKVGEQENEGFHIGPQT